MKYNMPEHVIRSGWNKVSSESKKAFFSALILGMITHFYIFTNLLFNHDGTVTLGQNTKALTSARWALEWATGLSGKWQMPAVITLYSILFLSLAAALIVSVLKIRSTVGIVLTAGFVVTFPTITCTFSYLFTADAYFLSLLLAVLSVWLTSRFRFGFLPASLVLALSVGIYQAYYATAAGLFVLRAICDLLEEDLTWKEIWTRIGRYLAALALGMAFYYGILKLLLFVTHTALSDYRGINQMGEFSLSQLPGVLGQTLYEIYVYFFKSGSYSFLSNFTVWLQRIVVLAIPSLCAVLFFLKGKKKVLQYALAALEMVAFLFAINLMQVLNPQEAPHILMIYAFVLVFVLFVKLGELVIAALHPLSAKTVLAWGGMILSTVLIFQNYMLANASYLRLQISVNESYLFANRIVQRIEDQEAYSAATPILIVGNLPYENYAKPRDMFRIDDSMTGLWSDYVFYSARQTTVFINDYLGFAMLQPTAEQVEAVKSSPEFSNMPVYPAKGSVDTIAGVIVIKMAQ